MQIIITEHQLDIIKNLLEVNAPLLDNGDVKDFGNPSEVGTSATVTDTTGEKKRGKDVYGDEIGKFVANQNWYGRLRYNRL